MEDAFNSVALRELKCQGNRPWLGYGYREPDCGKSPKSVQRGASNVWFPAVRSAISIPPYSEFLAKIVTIKSAQLNKPQVLAPESEWVLASVVEEYGHCFSVEQLKAEIVRQFHDPKMGDISEDELREQEFQALVVGRSDSPDTDFVAEHVRVPEQHRHWLKSTRKVTRLREVRALYGFSRLFVRGEDRPDAKLSSLFPDDNKQAWLPAVETLGEGLFLAFDRHQLNTWAGTAFASAREVQLRRNAQRAAEQRGHSGEQIRIIEVLVHTIAHVLIDQLSLDSGYPSSSIRERLYTSGPGDVGLLLYTSSSDSAGSLGGIAALADPERLGPALDEALHRLSWCSADPVCIESRGSGTDARNLAACHCCILVPETSCERFNGGLDRGSIFGMPGHEGLGFVRWAENSPIGEAAAPSGKRSSPDQLSVPDEIRDSPWRSIYAESGEYLRALIAELVEVHVSPDSWGSDIGPDNSWQLELSWVPSQVAVVTDHNEERDEWLAERGWTVLHSDDFTTRELADEIARMVA